MWTHAGRSIRGQATSAVTASQAAAQIRGGCTAAWVARWVPSGEWHHCSRDRADGRPTSFFDLDLAAACWAASKARDQAALTETCEKAEHQAPLLADIEVWEAERRSAARTSRNDPRIGRRVVLTIVDYCRRRGAWKSEGETSCLGVFTRLSAGRPARPQGQATVACDDGETRRGQTWRLATGLDEIEAAWGAADVENRCRTVAAERAEFQRRCDESLERGEACRTRLRAAYLRSPTPGRAQALRQYGERPAVLLLEADAGEW